MAGSVTLAAEMAKALDLPPASVLTTLKALRADKSHKVIEVGGRGSSAKQMSEQDAIGLLVGVMSATASSDVARVTRLLLDMPVRHEPWRNTAGLERLRPQVWPLNDSHIFKDAFGALFSRAWRTPEQDEEERGDIPEAMWEERELPYDPLNDPASLRVMIAFNGYRTEGYGFVQARITKDLTIKSYYSTRTKRPETKDGLIPDDIGFELYEQPPTFAFAATLDGRGMRTLAQVLADPVMAGYRSRKHRRPAKRGSLPAKRMRR